MYSSVEEKLLILRSNEGEEFLVKESVARQSLILKNMIEDHPASTVIPLANVDSKTLAMVLEYLHIHGDSAVSALDKKNFDTEFVKKEDNDLFKLLSAAHYMDIRGLQDLVAWTIANVIKDLTVDQVRRYFHIENDFTPEEEAAIREENHWAFD